MRSGAFFVTYKHLPTMRNCGRLSFGTICPASATPTEFSMRSCCFHQSLYPLPWLQYLSFFPKDVSSQGSSEDCWRISHHTYPTHISHHTYPTHIHHTTHIPHISIQNVSHQYVSVQHVSHQYVSMQFDPFKTFASAGFAIRIPPIRIRSTRIPPIRIHAMRIHSMRIHSKGVHQQESQTYPTNTISHQYVSSTRIPPVRVHSMRIHSKSLHQQEWMAMSMSIIAYHFIPLLLGGNGNEYRNLAFPSILCKIINWI